MNLPENCPIDRQKYLDYKDYISIVNKSLENTSLPDLLCVTIAGSEELKANAKYFRSNSRRKFTAEILLRLLGECFAFIAVNENAVLNASYHHVRAALELEVIYNWVFHKKSKIDIKIERYFAYKSLSLFLLSANSESQDTTTSKKNSENKKEYWAELFNVSKEDLSEIKKWHPKTTYDTMLGVYPHSYQVKQLYDLLSHMTHFSSYNEILGVKSILGIFKSKGDSDNLESAIFFIINSLEVLYGFIENNIGFNSQVKFPKKA